MQKFACKPDQSLLDIQKFANFKGWKIIKVTWSKGVRKKRVPKYAVDMDELFSKDNSIPAHWNLYYI